MRDRSNPAHCTTVVSRLVTPCKLSSAVTAIALINGYERTENTRVKKILSRSKLSSINYLIIGKKSNIYTASLFFNIFSQIKIFSIIDIISTINVVSTILSSEFWEEKIFTIYICYIIYLQLRLSVFFINISIKLILTKSIIISSKI